MHLDNGNVQKHPSAVLVTDGVQPGIQAAFYRIIGQAGAAEMQPNTSGGLQCAKRLSGILGELWALDASSPLQSVPPAKLIANPEFRRLALRCDHEIWFDGKSQYSGEDAQLCRRVDFKFRRFATKLSSKERHKTTKKQDLRFGGITID